MNILKDKFESLIAYMLVAISVFCAGIFLYFIIALLIEVMSTILYSLYLIIGCIFYKVGYAILF